MYKSNKRQKELKRKKKQEEKILKRQKAAGVVSRETENTEPVTVQAESSEDAVEDTGTQEDTETAS
jgi:hypothetical protein